MTNTIYTNEELKQTIHALLLEKQRVQDLEEQLQNVDKSQLLELSERLTDLEEENEVLKQQHQAIKKHLIKSEENYQASQKTVEEINKSLEEASEQSLRHQQRIEKLVSIIKDKERTLSEYQQFEYGFKKTNEKKQALESELESERDTIELLKRKEEALLEKLHESHDREQQVEKNLQFLHKKHEELQAEAALIQQEHHVANSLLNTHHDAHRKASLQIKELSELLSQEKIEKEEAAEELLILQKQFDPLKNKVYASQHELAHLQSKHQATLELVTLLTQEKQQLLGSLSAKNQLFEGAENELELIKQMVANGLRETQELEARYLEAVNEKVLAISKTHQTQQHVEKQREEIRSLRDQLKEHIHLYHQIKEQSEQFHQSLQEAHNEKVHKLSEEIRLLTAQIDKASQDTVELHKYVNQNAHLKEELERVSKQLECAFGERQIAETQVEQLSLDLKEKEGELDGFYLQISTLLQEKQQIEQTLSSIQSEQEENEGRVRTAQQHLAKKMRETALLNDRIEEQNAELGVLQSRFEEAQLKMAQLQTHIDLQQQQEKQLQEKLHEQIKTAETQIHKWEDKYFHMYDKWQITESSNRELKALEEKYSQMQALVANLGSLLGAPLVGVSVTPVNVAPVKLSEEPLPKRSAVVVQQPSPEVKAEIRNASQPEALFSDQGLFDRPEPPVRYKQNLFD